MPAYLEWGEKVGIMEMSRCLSVECELTYVNIGYYTRYTPTYMSAHALRAHTIIQNARIILCCGKRAEHVFP